MLTRKYSKFEIAILTGNLPLPRPWLASDLQLKYSSPAPNAIQPFSWSPYMPATLTLQVIQIGKGRSEGDLTAHFIDYNRIPSSFLFVLPGLSILFPHIGAIP